MAMLSAKRRPSEATSLSWLCTRHPGDQDALLSRPPWKKSILSSMPMEQRICRLSSLVVTRIRMATKNLATECLGWLFHSEETKEQSSPRFHAQDIQPQVSSMAQLVRFSMQMPLVRFLKLPLTIGWARFDHPMVQPYPFKVYNSIDLMCEKTVDIDVNRIKPYESP